jgi:hypothetical protein
MSQGAQNIRQILGPSRCRYEPGKQHGNQFKARSALANDRWFDACGTLN